MYSVYDRSIGGGWSPADVTALGPHLGRVGGSPLGLLLALHLHLDHRLVGEGSGSGSGLGLGDM